MSSTTPFPSTTSITIVNTQPPNNNNPFSGNTTASSYFQTVIISLVALAIILFISVSFLWFRRRRLRRLPASDWPYTSPFGTGTRNRTKETKVLGPPPVLYEYELHMDDDEEEVQEKKVDREVSLMSHDLKSSDVRGLRNRLRSKAGEVVLSDWKPISVHSLDASTVSQSSFSARFPSPSNIAPALQISSPPAPQPNSTPGIPLSPPPYAVEISMLIAMPRQPVDPTRRKSVGTYLEYGSPGEEAEEEELPIMAMGSMVALVDAEERLTRKEQDQ